MDKRSKYLFSIVFLSMLLPINCFSQVTAVAFDITDVWRSNCIFVDDTIKMKNDPSSVVKDVKSSFSRNELRNLKRNEATIQFTPFMKYDGAIDAIDVIELNSEKAKVALSSKSILRLVDYFRSSVQYELPKDIAITDSLYYGSDQIIRFSDDGIECIVGNDHVVAWLEGGIMCIAMHTNYLLETFSFDYNREKWMATLSEDDLDIPFSIVCDALYNSESLSHKITRLVGRRQLKVFEENAAGIEAGVIIDDSGKVVGIGHICVKGPHSILSSLDTTLLNKVSELLMKSVRFDDHGKMKEFELQNYGLMAISVIFSGKHPVIKTGRNPLVHMW